MSKERRADPPKRPAYRDLEAQDHPLTPDERVDVGSEESMDASDPIAATAPGDTGDPVPSSGYPGRADPDRKGKPDKAARKGG